MAVKLTLVLMGVRLTLILMGQRLTLVLIGSSLTLVLMRLRLTLVLMGLRLRLVFMNNDLCRTQRADTVSGSAGREIGNDRSPQFTNGDAVQQRGGPVQPGRRRLRLPAL